MYEKINNKTSIIMAACDENFFMRQITSTSLGNISKYTDREDYEMILVDNNNQGRGQSTLNDRNNIILIDKYIEVEGDIGVSASLNLGFKNSDTTTKYLCFIHNDVFVWEGWLTKLRLLLEGGYDWVRPSQGRITREQVKAALEGKNQETLWEDAGLTLVTRELFEKIGGYDERFKSTYHEAAFRKKMSKVNNQGLSTDQVIITHIGGVTIVGTDRIYGEYRGVEATILDNEL
mgnify:CR=1 FL=1